MPKKENVSKSVIRRLPLYYHFVSEQYSKGVKKLSSREIADKMGLTASQVRQDFNCFGGFGHQGYGYSTLQLKTEIKNILGLDKEHKTVLIGAGNLGKAISSYMKFNKMGFKLFGIFDNDEKLIGNELNGFEIMDILSVKEFCKSNDIKSAILCIPQDSADSVVSALYSADVRSFWNFSHYDLKSIYNDVHVENIYIDDSLMVLSYYITNS